MLANCSAVQTLHSSGYSRLGGDRRKPPPYFCRPKFLLAPDPSTLAQPPFVVKERLRAGGSDRMHTPFPMRAALSQFSTNIEPFTQANRDETGTTQGRTHSSTLSDSPQSPPEVHSRAFPPPPTLADIRRMEPDLSPTSAIRRAGHVFNPSSALPASRALPLHGNVVPTDECVRPFRLVVDNSPVVITRKRSRTSTPDCSPTAPIDGSTHPFRPVEEDSPIVLTHKRARTSTLDTHAAAASLFSFHESRGNRVSVDHAPTTVDKGPHMADSRGSTPVPPRPLLATYTLAEWLSDYLFTVVTIEESCDLWPTGPRAELSSQARLSAAWLINGVIENTQPSDSATFLALWYISRLLPAGLIDARDKHEAGSVEILIFRVFLLGSMLANKWVDDYSVRMASWKQFSELSLQALTSLEVAALIALQYNLAISNDDWRNWLIHLTCHPSMTHQLEHDCGPPRSCVAQLINDILGQSPPCSPPTIESLRPISVASLSTSSLDLLRLRLVEGLKVVHKLATSLPEPAPWFPAADPIIERGSRTLNIPLCAVSKPTRPTIVPTNAADVLANILGTHALNSQVCCDYDMPRWKGPSAPLTYRTTLVTNISYDYRLLFPSFLPYSMVNG